MEPAKRSKVEIFKENSRQLRGSIAEELAAPTPNFSDESEQLLKIHGIYQQDDRDQRKAKNPDGTPKGKQHIFMTRTRIPGGRVTAAQFLTHLDLCEQYGNGTLRVTDRQAFQLHGVIKTNLKPTLKAINEALLSTLAACGDVERNVMCCPAPHRHSTIHQEIQQLAHALAMHLAPKTTAYHEIWLTDESGEKTNVAEFVPVDEPLYGKVYLPRKFKTAIALPEDNCIDIYTQDLGFLAVHDGQRIEGYNVLVGGGMGRTPSAEKTFPALAHRLTFVRPDQVLDIATAVIKVQRDFGNREDRKVARLKYLIHKWGLPAFKAKVEEYFGAALPEPHPADVTGVEDHLGWQPQGDGRWALGVNIDCGRIKDEGPLRVKTLVRTLLLRYGMETRLTAMQSVLFCDIEPHQRADIDRLLVEHGVKPALELLPTRRLSMACPAFPTCGLAVAESERIYVRLMDDFESELERLGLAQERIAMHMTGCPNGCARPYTPDVGIVGRTLGKYTIFLGGNVTGTRLGFIYRDQVPESELVNVLVPVLERYQAERQPGESFGDFCHRLGPQTLATVPAEEQAADATDA